MVIIDIAESVRLIVLTLAALSRCTEDAACAGSIVCGPHAIASCTPEGRGVGQTTLTLAR